LPKDSGKRIYDAAHHWYRSAISTTACCFDEPDSGCGAAGYLMCATIILAVISHRIPQMVVGGGHNGAIGGVGVMTFFAAGMTGMGLAGRLSGNPAAMLATDGVGDGAKMLQDRIAAAEAAMGGQKFRRPAIRAGLGVGRGLAR